jgi:glycosyltransferase involved in cell wall biosynthesis
MPINVNKGLVSIIIPVFNGERFIGRAINSCLKSSYENIEIIVIDDGSNDGTKDVVSSFLADNRVLYFFQENKERSAARNAGILKSRGEFIQFLDADDEILSTKLVNQVDILNVNLDFNAVYGECLFFANGKSRYLFVSPKSFLKQMIVSNFIPINSILFRKKGIEIFDESIRLLEDWKFLINYLVNKNKILAVKDLVCIVHIHGENSSFDRVQMINSEMVVINWMDSLSELNDLKIHVIFSKCLRLVEVGKFKESFCLMTNSAGCYRYLLKLLLTTLKLALRNAYKKYVIKPVI